MPAVSQAQQRAMAIALHAPGKLKKRNQGLLKMSKNQLSGFASTPRAPLPKRKKKPAAATPEMGMTAMQSSAGGGGGGKW